MLFCRVEIYDRIFIEILVRNSFYNYKFWCSLHAKRLYEFKEWLKSITKK